MRSSSPAPPVALIRKLSPGGTDFLAFGYAVSGLGDVSGDGVPDIAVGAPTLSQQPVRAGLRVLRRDRRRPLAHERGAPGNRVVRDLARFDRGADHNGDGRRDLLVGAFFHDFDTGPGSGRSPAARISCRAQPERRSGTTTTRSGPPARTSASRRPRCPIRRATASRTTQSAIRVPPASTCSMARPAAGAGTIATPGSATDNFGADGATSEDRDADGKADLWVGAPSGGKVYLVKGTGAVLLTLTDPTPVSTTSILGARLCACRERRTSAAMPARTCSSATPPRTADPGGRLDLALIAANTPPVADAGADGHD